ncbi:MAG: hypothetical protein ACPL07_01665, partial [Candidatus Bathyarchaeia archaeon]
MNVLFKTAELEFIENRRKNRMGTGFLELDSLLGGIEEGMFYLFYGEKWVLDLIVHTLIVKCVMPKDRGGFESKCIYFNSTNYYLDKTVLDPNLLGKFSKKAGLDPKTVLENVYTAVAYNEGGQLTVAEKLCDLIGEDDGIRLLIAHNIAVFLKSSRCRRKSLENLKKVVNMMWEKVFEHNVAFFATVEQSSERLMVEPSVGTYLRHRANVIVYVKRLHESRVPSFKACLVKHPYYPRNSIIVCCDSGGDFMGRITPSFRQRYENEVKGLRESFQNYLVDKDRRRAFDLLL